MHTGVSQEMVEANSFLGSRATVAASEAPTARAAYPETDERAARLLDGMLRSDPATRLTAGALVSFLGATAESTNDDDEIQVTRLALAAKDAALAANRQELAAARAQIEKMSAASTSSADSLSL